MISNTNMPLMISRGIGTDTNKGLPNKELSIVTMDSCPYSKSPESLAHISSRVRENTIEIDANASRSEISHSLYSPAPLRKEVISYCLVCSLLGGTIQNILL